MPAEQIFILVTTIVAALLGLGALVAILRERQAAGVEAGPIEPAAKYGPSETAFNGLVGGAAYRSAVRILWWVSIAGVLVGVGLTDAYPETRTSVYVLGAAAVGVAVILHDLLPARWRTTPSSVLEVVLALALVTTLLALTGYGASPFVYAYNLVAVAVSLALGPRLALGVAALASVSYLGVLALDPALASYSGSDLLRFGLNVASIWLLAFLAGVFASGERRMRTAVLQMSRTDSLTGLMNRNQLHPMLEQEVQRTRRSERGFCMLMIDLDGLKAVNDSYGHHRGDEVLRALGAVIRRSIRSVDTAFRHGGDEFMVLLPETDFAGAFVVAEKIRAGAEQVGLAIGGGGDLLTSVSVGLVSCPEDGTSAEDLMIAADRAMYQAKSLGKNQVSGNPRPRRIPTRLVPVGTVEAQPSPAGGWGMPGGAVEQSAREAIRGLPPGVATRPAPVIERVPSNGVHEPIEEESDPSEVRRHIVAARRHLDADHQIRRAMDAFLSPPSQGAGGEPGPTTPPGARSGG